MHLHNNQLILKGEDPMIFLGISCIFALVAFIATRRVLAPVIVFFLTLFVSYFGLPVLSFGFWGLPWLALLAGIICFVCELESRRGEPQFKKGNRWVGAVILAVISMLHIILVPMLSSPLFHAGVYRGLIGDVKESTFSTDTAPVDPSQVRIVDQSLARRLGEKRLGEDPGLGSQVNLGTMNIQQVNDQLYWVGPLEHSGFFRWWSNSRGTIGYIKVSATNERDIELVRDIDGEKIAIKYNKGAFFNDDPHRYLYMNGYASVGLTDWTFEIDDSGRPYYVITRYEKKVGYFGNDPTGVIVLDVQNGDIEEYDIDDAPSWIDRIQPTDIMESQLDDWGMFVHGWLNPSQKDRMRTTPGMSLVYGDTGDSYWYTGMTSVGGDESTVGFVLINTRTKEAKFYSQPGATERAAMQSAEGAVQEKGYKATFPIMYNVSGVPTYFTTLKDNAGLVKLMAFVSVENYSLVGIGENVQAALQAYRRVVNSRGNAIVPNGAVERYEAQGVVERLATEVKGGNTNYYFVITGTSYSQKQFVGSSDISPELINTELGDEVTIIFEDGGSATIYISQFDNMELDFQKTEAQIGVEERFEAAKEKRQTKRDDRNLDAAWDDLSPEEKREMMKKQ